MTKTLNSSPQSPCVKRQQAYFKTPTRHHRRSSISMLVPPPAPRKRSETELYDEARYSHVFGGRRNLYVPSFTNWDTTASTSEDARSPHLTVQLRPRFTSSCFTSQLLQETPCGGALPLFPVLDDGCISDDDSEATDYSPMPLDFSESLDF